MSETTPREPLIEVSHLKKYYPVRGGGRRAFARAIDDVSFTVYRGETLGLVGESGCGKTTTGRAILRLIDPTEGKIVYDGTDITRLSEHRLRPLRPRMQIIFQDPYGCLDPRKTVFQIIAAPLRRTGLKDREALRKKVTELMNAVGLREDYIDRFPHEFSGGQRQRVGIARALAMDPEFIVCDEPVSALDVSVQAQVVNLIRDLQRQRGLTYLFISHDLRVVRHICDRIVVMYLGKIVESGSKEDIFSHTAHPYTQALLSAVPEAGESRAKDRIILTGDVPSPIDPPSGCRFHTRCPRATERCRSEEPPLTDLGGGHLCACHFCGNTDTGESAHV